MNQERLIKIMHDIYREEFANSDPPGDFDELMKSGIAKTPDFFCRYYISQEDEDKIIKKHLKLNKISEKSWEGRCIRNSVLLGCSPVNHREAQERYLKELNGRPFLPIEPEKEMIDDSY